MSDSSITTWKDPRLKQGTLRKKNSLYFKKGYEINFKDTEDLRSTVTRRLKNATLGRGDKRSNSIFSVQSRKQSVYKTGTLEHRLHSIVDMAHLEFQDLGPDEEEYNKQREKHFEDKRTYEELGSDPTFTKYHNKCKRRAKHELETFYEDAEKELDDIEKLLGLDNESLKRIEKTVRDAVKERESEEKKKDETQEKEIEKPNEKAIEKPNEKAIENPNEKAAEKEATASDKLPDKPKAKPKLDIDSGDPTISTKSPEKEEVVVPVPVKSIPEEKVAKDI